MAFTPGNIGDADSVVIKVTVDAKDAVDGMKRVERVATDKFGVVTKRVAKYNEELKRWTTTVTKENEKLTDQMGDFVRKHKDAFAAVAVTVAAIKKSFDLALFAAKKSSDESSKAFLKAYGDMNRAVEDFKVAIGKALIPALTSVANALTVVVDKVQWLVEHAPKAPGGLLNSFSVLTGHGSTSTVSGIIEAERARQAASGRIAPSAATLGKQLNDWIEAKVREEAFEDRAALARYQGAFQGASRYRGPWSGANRRTGAAEAEPTFDPYRALRGRSFSDYRKDLESQSIDAELARLGVERGGIDADLDFIGKQRARQSAASDDRLAGIQAYRDSIRELTDLENSNALAGGKTPDILERIFGDIDQFKTWGDAFVGLADTANAAFTTMAGTVGTAFDSWITGQDSVKASFKKAVAEGLRATATQAAVESVMEGARALAALAVWNLDGAAKHGAAAAAFAGVAALAGVGAKKLGQSTGQWETTPAKAAVGGGSAVAGLGRSGGASSGGYNIVINAGDSLMDESPRAQRARFGRAIEIAHRQTRSTTLDFK